MEVEPLIYWEFFRPIIRYMYNNSGKLGVRPNNDGVIMIKMLVSNNGMVYLIQSLKGK